ncbi:MAG TPA: transposase, partial [Bacteroidia bacterium]|nr:transposase [Bacteroidia bacterium]
ESIKFVNEKYSCEIISYVWMPNHIHLICYFTGQNKLIEYMRDFKKYTSIKIRDHIYESKNQELIAAIQYAHRKQKIKIWQDRFDDLHLFRGKTLLQKLRYIHNNPVRRGLCSSVWEYADSSAAFYINGEVSKIPIRHCSEIILEFCGVGPKIVGSEDPTPQTQKNGSPNTESRHAPNKKKDFLIFHKTLSGKSSLTVFNL